MWILDYVTMTEDLIDGRRLIKVQPDIFFPAALRYCAQIKKGKQALPSWMPEDYSGRLHNLPEAIWLAVLEDAAGVEPNQRNEALEVARLIFTAILREVMMEPIHLLISKSSGKYRLSPIASNPVLPPVPVPKQKGRSGKIT